MRTDRGKKDNLEDTGNMYENRNRVRTTANDTARPMKQTNLTHRTIEIPGVCYAFK